jgi:hypothetical protein
MLDIHIFLYTSFSKDRVLEATRLCFYQVENTFNHQEVNDMTILMKYYPAWIKSFQGHSIVLLSGGKYISRQDLLKMLRSAPNTPHPFNHQEVHDMTILPG